jgi:hypothetical protein
MSEEHEQFDPADYSVVVKLRGNPPKPWRWEIYRAGRWGPIQSSSDFFESMAEASKAGKKALAQLLAKAKHAAWRLNTMSKPDEVPATPFPASQRYRARAEDCRLKAQSFRNEKARTQMLQLAADYDRKAVQAEAFEVQQPKNK